MKCRICGEEIVETDGLYLVGGDLCYDCYWKEDEKENPIQELDQVELPATEQWNITHYSQPYECSTKIGAEVDSKGNIKPNAQVTITRKFEGEGEIVDCIHADVSRGVEEVTEAIKEVIRNYQEE